MTRAKAGWSSIGRSDTIRRERASAFAPLSAAALVLAVAGYGATAHRAVAMSGTARVSSTRTCLERAGFRTSGGHTPGVDRGSASYELVANKRTGIGVFLGFYDTVGQATTGAATARVNARRFHGLVERRGRVTVVWTAQPSRHERQAIQRCLT